MAHYSPLRYPGGKGKLSVPIKEILKVNNLYDSTYLEPYAGGCGIGIYLLLRGIISRLVINDIDPAVHSYWRLVLKDTSEFIEWIDTVPLTIDEWRNQKAIYAEGIPSKDLGRAFFYLNRTNRSGVLNAGVIGGNDQSGNYKIDARFNRDDLKKRVKQISALKNRIVLHNLDALDFLVTTKSSYKKSFYFIDPPYVVKGSRLYLNFYREDDHRKLASYIAEHMRENNWVTTYDSAELIEEIYSDFNQLKYSLHYSVKNGRTGSEILIYPNHIKLPEHNFSLCA